MFTERFNKIMKIIGAKPTDIAGIIGCDRSAVDRICKGSRVPQNGGKSALRIVSAIFSFADEHGKTEDILKEIGCSACFSAEQIKGEIMRWLYDGEEPIKAHKEAPTVLHTHNKFGQRFSAILDLAEFSNVRFGKLLNIDPSYISRFRNGLRTPVSNSKLTGEMCRVLYSRLKDQNRLSDLARSMNISPENLHNDTDWEEELYSWLFLSEDNKVSSFVVGMVDQIGSFSADIIKSPLPFEMAADKTALSDDQPLYRDRKASPVRAGGLPARNRHRKKKRLRHAFHTFLSAPRPVCPQFRRQPSVFFPGASVNRCNRNHPSTEELKYQYTLPPKIRF